jgi:tetratricopeptide (TPR) repeat protein
MMVKRTYLFAATFLAASFCPDLALTQEVQSQTTPSSQPVLNTEADRAGEQLRSAMRRIAARSTDTDALIDAGNASLTLGDPNAALNFFTRADALQPSSGRIKLGLAAASVRTENPFLALRLFDEAIRLGISERAVAADRALAYDLLGNFKRAQQDYNLARTASTSSSLVVQQAVSLSLMGQRDDADRMLTTLLQRNDPEAWRARALLLAARGEYNQSVRVAQSFLDQRSVQSLDRYLRQMPQLTVAQQAAAINLGHFPVNNIGRDIAAVQQASVELRANEPASSAPPAGGQGRLIPSGSPLGGKADTKTVAVKKDKDKKSKDKSSNVVAANVSATNLGRGTGAFENNARNQIILAERASFLISTVSSLNPPQPALQQPVQSQSVTQQTAMTQPASIANPGLTRPVISQPTLNQPAAQQPTTIKPATPAPIITQSMPSQPPLSNAPINPPASTQAPVNSPVIMQPAITQPVSGQAVVLKPNMPATTVLQPAAPQVTAPQPVVAQPVIAQAPIEKPPVTMQQTVAAPTQGPIQSQAGVIPDRAIPAPSTAPILSPVAPALPAKPQTQPLPQTQIVAAQESQTTVAAKPEQIATQQISAPLTNNSPIIAPQTTFPQAAPVQIASASPVKIDTPSVPVTDQAISPARLPTPATPFPPMQQDSVPAISNIGEANVQPVTTNSSPAEPSFDLGAVVDAIEVPEEESKPSVVPVDLTKIQVAKPKQAEPKIAEVKPAVSPATQNPARYWVQIATGERAAFKGDMRRYNGKYGELFRGIQGWASPWGRMERLVVGPFDNIKAAKKWEADFRKAGGDGFVWQSSAGVSVEALK